MQFLLVFLMILTVSSIFFSYSTFGDNDLENYDTYDQTIESKFQSDDKPSVSVITERIRYVPGQAVVIFGSVFDETGNPANAKVLITIVHNPEQTPDKIIYKTSVVSDMGNYRDDGFNLEQVGKYKVTVTVFVNGREEVAWTNFEVKEYYFTTAAFILYIGILSLAGLMVVIAKGTSIAPAIREILRFVFITIIALVPVTVFVLTDVEIGQNAPIGLVNKITLSTDPNSGQLFQENEWVINIGGDWRSYYNSGIQIPVFVFIFGLGGGYIRYLHMTYKEWSDHVEAPQTAKEKEQVRREVFNHSIKDLALLFLSPLLAIASYFLLLQAGVGSDDLPTIAAVSFAVGLVTDTVISRLGEVAGGALGKKSDQKQIP